MRSACSRGCVRGARDEIGRCRRVRRGDRRPRSGAGARRPRRRRPGSGRPRGRTPAVGATRRGLAELRRTRLRRGGQRIRSPDTSCGSGGPGGSRPARGGGARRAGVRARTRRDLSAQAAAAARIAGGACASGRAPPPRRREVRRARSARRRGARRHPAGADARLHGRSQLRRVHRAASPRRRRDLPGDAHAVIGRAGGAAGGLRRRVLPPRLGSLRADSRATSSAGRRR